MNTFPWITLITLIPLGGAVVIALAGRKPSGGTRSLALVFSLIPGLFALLLASKFEQSVGSARPMAFGPDPSVMQFVERHAWIPTLGVDYHVGLDGLGLSMVLLTSFVIPFAIAATRGIKTGQGAYFALMLTIQGALYGAFTSMNFFHWFIFWELSLIPAYFLVRLWGGTDRRRAANQFFVYTMVGSIALLLAMVAVFLVSGTFDFAALSSAAARGDITRNLESKLGWLSVFSNGKGLGLFVFCLALLGFAIKVPLFPFHTWLPLTYTQAPTSTTMVLTGVLSKLGLYGMLRILMPVYKEQAAQLAAPLLVLACATILLSTLAALSQKDLKTILAYSSINHLGYCLLGIFALATTRQTPGQGMEDSVVMLFNGVSLQMFNHGVIASSLFCFVGFLESRPEGCPNLVNSGGLRKRAPVLAGLMGVALFASLGLPGLSGFVGEFLIFKGTFGLAAWAAALCTLGLLLSALFHLNIIQKVFCGPLKEPWLKFSDLTTEEWVTVLPAIALLFMLGFWPQLLVGITRHFKGF